MNQQSIEIDLRVPVVAYALKIQYDSFYERTTAPTLVRAYNRYKTIYHILSVAMRSLPAHAANSVQSMSELLGVVVAV